MSTNLFWQPLQPARGNCLPKALKYRLARRYWDHDGTLSGHGITLSENDATYLQGIADGSSDKEVIEGAQKLIEAIQQYGVIEIWIE